MQVFTLGKDFCFGICQKKRLGASRLGFLFGKSLKKKVFTLYDNPYGILTICHQVNVFVSNLALDIEEKTQKHQYAQPYSFSNLKPVHMLIDL